MKYKDFFVSHLPVSGGGAAHHGAGAVADWHARHPGCQDGCQQGVPVHRHGSTDAGGGGSERVSWT